MPSRLGGYLLLCACLTLSLSLLAGKAHGQEPPPEEIRGLIRKPEFLPVQESTTNPAEIRKNIEELLKNPEYRRVKLRRDEVPVEKSNKETPEWLKRFLEWLAELLGRKGADSGGEGASLVAWGILAILCGLIIYMIARWVGDYQKKLTGKSRNRPFEVGEADLPPGEIPADVYVGKAREMAAQGLYREAIGQLLLGAMSTTERNGWIRFRRGLTYRDYLRALRSRGEAGTSFRSLVGIYEPIGFGRRPATLELFERSLQTYEEGFTHAQV